MDQPLQSQLVAGKKIAGDNIPPAKISDDLTQIYLPNDLILPALQFPYIPYYNFPNINLENNNINISDYCSLTNQTFKKRKPEPEMTSFHFTPTVLFSQLPGLDLHSLEHVTNPSLTNHSKLTEPIPLQQSKQTRQSSRPVRVDEKRRIRRKKISEKTFSLQKLLPSSHKRMDMASVYEEAGKYIKYLKAQIKVLEAMSVGDNYGFGVNNGSCSGSNFGCESSGNDSGGGGGDDGYGYGYGALKKLKRGELLKVLLNSESAQGMMYSRGFCVYSAEQKVLLKELDDKHLLSTDPSFYY